MLIAGLLIMGGALLNMLLFGFKGWALLCMAAGAAAALIDTDVFKNRFNPAADRSIFHYKLLVAAVLLLTVLAAPLILGGSAGPENLDRAIKKSASLLAAGDLDRAEQLLIKLERQYPEVDKIQLNLSTLYLMKGNPAEAARKLDSRKESRYYNADECFNYAMTYYQQGYYADALLYLKKALRQEPDREDDCLYASECAYRLADYQAAQYFARRVVELKPDLPRGHVQLAKIQLMLMEYREAAAELEIALGLNPNDSLQKEILKLKEAAAYYKHKM